MQDLQLGFIQPGKPFLDDAFHTGWGGAPIQIRLCHPVSVVVQRQLALLPKHAQQLDHEQRVALGPLVQALPEIRVEPIGLGVNQLVDELFALCAGARREIDDHIAEGAFELVDHMFKGMAAAVGSLGQVVRPVGAQEQDAPLGDSLTQME